MNKKGFTLVELLAVIVILAVILVIAVPKITSTINSTRNAAYTSSAKMIAQGAEREYSTRQMLGTLDQTRDAITCADVADLSSDYGECTITWDGTTAKISFAAGSGKFADCTITNATANGNVVAAGGNCAS